MVYSSEQVAIRENVYIGAGNWRGTDILNRLLPEFSFPLGAPMTSSPKLDSTTGTYSRAFASGTTASFHPQSGLGQIKWAHQTRPDQAGARAARGRLKRDESEPSAQVSTTVDTVRDIIRGGSGCAAPRWNVSYSMADSLYMYCYEPCPIGWLANNTQHGEFGGIVGYDHYYTHQGMPCDADGMPQEFEFQDAQAVWQKQALPKSRVLQYRINDAVSYAKVVREKQLSDPSYFVTFHHPPLDNGSICENHVSACFSNKPPYINDPAHKCPFEIRSSAYNMGRPAVQDWVLENVFKPVMKVADGAWIDGDGPDNGAWMCSDRGPNINSTMNATEKVAYEAGWAKVLTAARTFMIEHGGFEYNCFTFITHYSRAKSPKGSAAPWSRSILPQEGDASADCAWKLKRLAAAAANASDPTDMRYPAHATVLYSDRNNGNVSAIRVTIIFPPF